VESKNPVMQEFWAGFAAFIKSFWNQAARQGFSIMLLIITNVGFIFWIDRLNSDMLRMRAEHRVEIMEVRNEYRGDIQRLRVVIDSLKNGLDDCNEARIRLESQNATLLAFMKQKR